MQSPENLSPPDRAKEIVQTIRTKLDNETAVLRFLEVLQTAATIIWETSPFIFRDESKNHAGFSALLPPREGLALSLKREGGRYEWRWILLREDFDRLQVKYNLRGWDSFAIREDLGNASIRSREPLPEIGSDLVEAWHRGCTAYLDAFNNARVTINNEESRAYTELMTQLIEAPDQLHNLTTNPSHPIHKTMTFFDWMPFFKELCVRIAALSTSTDNRTELLRDAARNVFGDDTAILKYNSIDPLSFLYMVARHNGLKEWDVFAQRLRTHFSLTSDLPTDRYFPTPSAFQLFYFTGESDYRTNAGVLEDPDLPWEAFLAILSDNRKAEIPEFFRRLLNLRNVGVAKLTQTMFLIRPDLYLPLDKPTRLPFGGPNEPEVMAEGWPAYGRFLDAFHKAMPGCAPYEANILGYVLRSKSEKVQLQRNWFQVSSKVDGGSDPHQFEDFVDAGAVWTGTAASNSGKEYALDIPQRGDLMLVRNGVNNLGAISMVWENEYAADGFTPDAMIRVLWFAREPRYIEDKLGDWRAFSRATHKTVDAFAQAYPETAQMINALFEQIPLSDGELTVPEPESIQPDSIVTNRHPVNTILYGPPGTGKTYSSIAYALAVIENKPIKEINQRPREQIKAQFDSLLIRNWDAPLGQIGFTTFHQSMTYEDFVEGIKPEEPGEEDEYLNYSVRDGIFKAITSQASTPEATDFNRAYQALQEEIKELDGEPLLLRTPVKNKEFGLKLNRRGSLSLYTGNRSKPAGSFTQERLLEQLNGGDFYEWWLGYYEGIIEHLRSRHGYNSTESGRIKPYVLIIDEINRGNISQIFGELITLIEKDKRAGQDEALSVTLPYSRENFSVPFNLYIIGTMNTADRSVEALDTALRRRFSFIEMPPVEDHPAIATAVQIGTGNPINFQTVLQTINKRLEKLVGRDHKIGHSYFLGEKNWEDYLHAFTDKIIPLLQEYFYGDWSKMCLVLGQGFVTLKEPEAKENFFALLPAKTDSVDAISDLQAKESWELVRFEPAAAGVEEKFGHALRVLLGLAKPGDPTNATTAQSIAP